MKRTCAILFAVLFIVAGTGLATAADKAGWPEQLKFMAGPPGGNWFALGGALFGAFIGLVIGGKLLALSVKRRRTDYEADRASCLACGRCYSYCPKEHERLKQKKEAVVAHG